MFAGRGDSARGTLVEGCLSSAHQKDKLRGTNVWPSLAHSGNSVFWSKSTK